METQTSPRASLHPLVATAAVAVILASAVGVAAMTGVLPTGSAKQAEPALVAQTAAVPALVAQPVAVAPAPVVAPEPKPAPKHVAKVAHKPRPVVLQPEPMQVAEASVPPPGTYPSVPPDYRPAVQQPTAAARPVCSDCGKVESMREVDKKGAGTGAGAVAGGIGGLILGHQLGNGSGNKIATVLGAVGGAFAGNAIEKKVRTIKSYEISVRMEDGTYRTVTQDSAPVWRAGDHVRIVNGALAADAR